MSTKVPNKISTLDFKDNQVITTDQCTQLKGGGSYYCCTRNKWINY